MSPNAPSHPAYVDILQLPLSPASLLLLPLEAKQNELIPPSHDNFFWNIAINLQNQKLGVRTDLRGTMANRHLTGIPPQHTRQGILQILEDP